MDSSHPSSHRQTRPTPFHTTVMIAMLCCTSLVITAMLTTAGPLDPPVGAVAPSYKTLAEVEPRIPLSQATTPGDASSIFKITQPGSYYLTANMAGLSGKTGIVIASNDVTVDLSGYTMTGVPGALMGILSSGFRSGITVRNGTLRSWPAGGIRLENVGAATRGYLVHSIRAVNNGAAGIIVGESVVIEQCEASGNTGIGIMTGSYAALRDCVAVFNAGDGFYFGDSTAMTGCVARGNTGSGFKGIARFVVIDHCTSAHNQQSGFNVLSGSILQCAASLNTAHGIMVGEGVSVIRDCAVVGTESGTGIAVVGSRCIIADNQVSLGATGVAVFGGDNRVENNNVSASGVGFDIQGSGNVIVRNSASGGTTRFHIAAGNATGQIISSSAVTTSTISTANYDY